MNQMKTFRRSLALGVSALAGTMAGYGRAFGQTACTISGSNYVCTGSATAQQNLTLDAIVTGITTQPPFVHQRQWDGPVHHRTGHIQRSQRIVHFRRGRDKLDQQ